MVYEQYVGKWSEDEDKLLTSLVPEKGKKNWIEISSQIQNRTRSQCMQRYYQVVRPGLKKGSWTKEEDELLASVVYDFLGDKIFQKPVPKIRNWKFCEKVLPNRTSKQCRERWTLALDPCINHSEWSNWEDNKLITLQTLIGNKWCLIKELLNTNRTENSVKLRYNKIQRNNLGKRKQEDENSVCSKKSRESLTVEDFMEVEQLLRK
eukprot:snap_masked-scaffold_50-processed-gene-0.23-mRNA-1 protein AED:0.25 eAED:0.28 QI:0/-1/0/1/-1/1/1/0/206